MINKWKIFLLAGILLQAPVVSNAMARQPENTECDEQKLEQLEMDVGWYEQRIKMWEEDIGRLKSELRDAQNQVGTPQNPGTILKQIAKLEAALNTHGPQWAYRAQVIEALRELYNEVELLLPIIKMHPAHIAQMEEELKKYRITLRALKAELSRMRVACSR